MAQRNTNPPEHIFDESHAPPLDRGVNRATREELGQPTGEGTSPVDDVADPHPADGQNYDRIPSPGGDDRHEDIGPNPAVHTGTAPPRPRNVETEPGPPPSRRS